jgi:hypothetical protein
VQLAMAFWMKKSAVGSTIRAAQHFWDDVMAVPPGLASDGISAFGALPGLSAPEIEQYPTTLKRLGHVSAVTSTFPTWDDTDSRLA